MLLLYLHVFYFLAVIQIHELKEKKVPEALQNKSYKESYSSKSRGDNLIENLYADVVANSTQLMDFERKISDLRNSKKDSVEMYDNYNSKNKSYYSSVTIYTRQIGDSVLREKIEKLISNSSANYDSSVLPFTKLLKVIDTKTASLNDLHILLKLNQTLPLIEKYQKNNLPSTKPLLGFINNIDKALKLAHTLVEK